MVCLERIVLGVLFGLIACVGQVLADDEDFSGQELKSKSFVGKSMNRSKYVDAVLEVVDFTNASLKKANFKGATIKGVYFHQVDLTEADFTGATGGTGPIRFADAKLNKAELPGLTLDFGKDCRLRDANLRKAKITSASANCDFSGARLEGANLRGSQIRQDCSSRFKGAFYDDDTSFPEGFSPKEAGMILQEKGKEMKP